MGKAEFTARVYPTHYILSVAGNEEAIIALELFFF